ncbi:MAG: BNR-4 repeat-containing protein [Planctomycetota bacterium]
MAEKKAPTSIVINNNGGWCWFQNERALVHQGKLWVASVASGRGPGGNQRVGNIEVATYEFVSGQTTRSILHAHLQEDDHCSPALYVMPDDRVLAMYGKHSTDHLCRWRITESPNDSSTWLAEQQLDVGDRYCYSNLYALDGLADRLFNFHRGRGYKPNYLISDDHGETWRYGGKLMTWNPEPDDPKSTGHDGRRPYIRYASNNRDTIHFATTEEHPRGYDNSIYHGSARLIEDQMMLCQSNGQVIGPLSDTDQTNVQPPSFTRVYEGDRNHVAWTVDLRLDAQGLPVMVFSTQRDGGDVRDDIHAGGSDLRYHYARFDGERWIEHEMAFAGRALYPPEVDYPGLAAIHPYAVDTVYISTDAHPVTGKPLISAADNQRHYEIFCGHSDDFGQTWSWTPITQNSKQDNLRPIVAPGDPTKAPLLWLRGKLHSYQHYNLRVVMLSDPPLR